MRSRARLSIFGVLLCWAGFDGPAQAQGGPYAGGVLFADLQRASGETSTSGYGGFIGGTKFDGTTIGGGIRGGAFLAPRWSLELGVDFGAKIDNTVTPPIVPLRFSTIPAQPTVVLYPQSLFEERLTARTTATTVLIGYHPPSHGRLRAGFGGGLSFIHTATTLVQTVGYRFFGDSYPPPPIPAPFTTRIDGVANQVAATVGGELTFALSPRAAIVPEIRAHGFESRFVIRPGVGLRWQW